VQGADELLGELEKSDMGPREPGRGGPGLSGHYFGGVGGGVVWEGVRQMGVLLTEDIERNEKELGRRKKTWCGEKIKASPPGSEGLKKKLATRKWTRAALGV